MNKKIVIGIILIVALIIAAIYVFSQGASETDEPILPPAPNMGTVNPPATGETPPPVESQVKTFTVTGSNFTFSPAEIRVGQGDRVRIIFNSEEGTHDWVVDAFNARTPIIQSGQSATIEFTANQAGTFQYYCSVGNHRQMGMVGNLVVE